jgi:hypothetical protein
MFKLFDKKDVQTKLFIQNFSKDIKLCPEFSESVKDDIEKSIGNKANYLSKSTHRFELKSVFYQTTENKLKAVTTTAIFRMVYFPKNPEKRYVEIVTVEDFGRSQYNGDGTFSYNFPSVSSRYLSDIDNFSEHWKLIWLNLIS